MGEDLSKGPIIYLFDGRWLSFLAKLPKYLALSLPWALISYHITKSVLKTQLTTYILL